MGESANIRRNFTAYAPWVWEDEKSPLKMLQYAFITDKAVK
jgi:hypothetical protein